MAAWTEIPTAYVPLQRWSIIRSDIPAAPPPAHGREKKLRGIIGNFTLDCKQKFRAVAKLKELFENRLGVRIFIAIEFANDESRNGI